MDRGVWPQREVKTDERALVVVEDGGALRAAAPKCLC